MKLSFDLVPQTRPKLGLVVLQADESLENDMRRMIPENVDLLVSRVPSATEVSTDSLAKMADALTGAASLFPMGAAFAVVGYGCTSGTAEIGAGKVAELIRAGTNAAQVTEPVTAVIAACKALKIRRLGLISPYVAEVSDKLIAVLKDAKIDVTDFASFEEASEKTVVQISPDSIAAAATDMARRGACDAVFVSCTNLRTMDVIATIEKQSELPVLTSNQVLAWDMLRRADIADRTFAPGRLWQV